MRTTLVSIVLLSMYHLSHAKACKNLPSNQTTFDVHFWNFYPYTTGNLSELHGVFNVIIRNLSTHSNLKLRSGKKNTYQEILALPSKGQKNQIALPVLIDTEDRDPCLVKVVKSTGYAYVVRRDVKKPLDQLAASFINGGQVIGLTLILTGIAGICMWLLDRRRNPEHFPAPFITGAWQGFWWAFVTMTTVGYGDLAPKSVPARMFSVLWMLLGLVAFSVLTANFTSSLAREIETDLNLFNKKVAVFKEGIERRAAINVGGKYKEYTSLSDGMMAALKNRHVEGLLIDKHAAVSNEEIIGESAKDIEIGKMVDSDHFIGMRLVMPNVEMCVTVKQCIEQQVETNDFQDSILKVLSNSTISNDDVEHAGSLFEDYEFFIILIALGSTMTGVGVLWEYFWYKPNMLKVMQNKTQDIEINGRNILKHILTDQEAKTLCENCCCTIEAIYQTHGHERKERLIAEDSLIAKLHVDNLIPFKKVDNLIPFKKSKKTKESDQV